VTTARIDAHHHLWDLAVRPQPWTAPFLVLARSFGMQDLLPELSVAGIDGTILVQTVDVAEETPELLAIAAGQPAVWGVIGWVNLQADDVDDQIAVLRAGVGGEYLVGIRHLVEAEPDPAFLARPAFRRGLTAVAAAGLVYDLLVRESALPAVIDTVDALPGLRVVLDHCGKPDLHQGLSGTWRRDVKALAEHGSVAVKLSGLVTQADHEHWTVQDLRPAADVVLEAFGSGRVMIGSDWPACLPAASYQEVMAAAEQLLQHLSPQDRAHVSGGTAADWYHLNPLERAGGRAL
jgi:L-fuconolactonase